MPDTELILGLRNLILLQAAAALLALHDAPLRRALKRMRDFLNRPLIKKEAPAETEAGGFCEIDLSKLD